jgi:hypothetical protein
MDGNGWIRQKIRSSYQWHGNVVNMVIISLGEDITHPRVWDSLFTRDYLPCVQF